MLWLISGSSVVMLGLWLCVVSVWCSGRNSVLFLWFVVVLSVVVSVC